MLIQTYSIEDCNFFDDATIDRTSKYDTTSSTGQTFSYDSNESAYKITRTSDGFGSIIVKDLSVDTDVEISIDFKQSSCYNNQPRLALFNANNGVCGRLAKFNGGNQMGLSTITKTADGTVIGSLKNISSNWSKYYTIKVIFDGSTVTEELYDGDTLIDSVTGTQSILSSNNNVGVQHCYFNGCTVYLKNLKVKPL